MATTRLTATNAQSRVAALNDCIAYHKRHLRKHRDALQQAARELEELNRVQARDLGFEVVIVQPAHSQEAQSQCPPKT